MSDRALYYVFILSLVLVALAYYTGLQTDAGALKDAFVSILYAITGRTSSGSFAGYPKAA
jgi:hypothetical protein